MLLPGSTAKKNSSGGRRTACRHDSRFVLAPTHFLLTGIFAVFYGLSACKAKLEGQAVYMGSRTSGQTETQPSETIERRDGSTVPESGVPDSIAPDAKNEKGEANVDGDGGPPASASIPLMSLRAPEQWVNEDKGSATFTLDFAQPPELPFDLPFAVSGDYTGANLQNGTLHIPGGVSSYLGTVSLPNDGNPHPISTLNITLQPPEANKISGTSTQTFKIIDDDGFLPIPPPSAAPGSKLPGSGAFFTSPDGTFRVSDNGTYFVMTNATTGAVIGNLPEVLGKSPTILGISADSNWLVAQRSALLGDPVGGLYLIGRDGTTIRRPMDYSMPGACYPSKVAFSPNANRFAYACTGALYLADSDGGNRVTLGGPYQFSSGTAASIAFSSDGTLIAYRATRDITGVYELFLAKQDGSEHRKVHPNLSAGQSVAKFDFSHDSAYLLYTSDELDTTKEDLFSVSTNLATPNPNRVSQTSSAAGTSVAFSASPDSSTVGYLMKKSGSSFVQVFTASINGSGEMLVSSASRNAADIKFSPDSSAIAYLEANGVASQYDLYYAAVGVGGARTKINGNVPPGCVYGVKDFSISPNGSRAIYSSCEGNGTNAELFSVAISGGSVTKLSESSPQTFTNIGLYLIANNSQNVVFTSDSDVDGFDRLYSVPIGGGSINSLSPPAQTLTGSVLLTGISITPDSSKVLYEGDLTENDRWELYSNSLPSGSFFRAEVPPPSPREKLSSMFLTEDGKFLTVWSAGYDSVSPLTYPFSIEVETGMRNRLVPTLDISGLWRNGLMNASYSPQANKFLVKVTDYNIFPVGLWAADSDGGIAVKLFPSLLDNKSLGNKYSCAIMSPDGLHAAYSSTITGGDAVIRIAATDGSTNIGLMDDLPLFHNGYSPSYVTCSDRFMFLPDSSKIIFFGDFDSYQFELWSANVDGTGRTRISPTLTSASGQILDVLSISPDSSHILLTADPADTGTCHIYATGPVGGAVAQVSTVPLDGGNACVGRAKYTDDSQHVVYRVRQGSIWKLYANSPGGGQEVLLSNLSAPTQSLQDFFPLGGNSVLYTADEETPGRIDVYLVNLDGTNHRRISNGTISVNASVAPGGSGSYFVGVSANLPKQFFLFNTVLGSSEAITLTGLGAGEAITNVRIIPRTTNQLVVTTTDPSKARPHSVYHLDFATHVQRLMTTSLEDPATGIPSDSAFYHFDDGIVKRFLYPIP
jgi:hypothetical protein